MIYRKIVNARENAVATLLTSYCIYVQQGHTFEGSGIL